MNEIVVILGRDHMTYMAVAQELIAMVMSTLLRGVTALNRRNQIKMRQYNYYIKFICFKNFPDVKPVNL